MEFADAFFLRYLFLILVKLRPCRIEAISYWTITSHADNQSHAVSRRNGEVRLSQSCRSVSHHRLHSLKNKTEKCNFLRNESRVAKGREAK